MTTQAQLIALAQRHRDIAAVQTLLTTIQEQQLQAHAQLKYLVSSSNVYQHSVEFEDGYRVPLDSSELVVAANKASAAMTTISATLVALAAVLGSLGEDISY